MDPVKISQEEKEKKPEKKKEKDKKDKKDKDKGDKADAKPAKPLKKQPTLVITPAPSPVPIRIPVEVPASPLSKAPRYESSADEDEERILEIFTNVAIMDPLDGALEPELELIAEDIEARFRPPPRAQQLPRPSALRSPLPALPAGERAYSRVSSSSSRTHVWLNTPVPCAALRLVSSLLPSHHSRPPQEKSPRVVRLAISPVSLTPPPPPASVATARANSAEISFAFCDDEYIRKVPFPSTNPSLAYSVHSIHTRSAKRRAPPCRLAAVCPNLHLVPIMLEVASLTGPHHLRHPPTRIHHHAHHCPCDSALLTAVFCVCVHAPLFCHLRSVVSSPQLNREYRGVDKPTDVLSFPLMEADVKARPAPGESPKRAVISGRRGPCGQKRMHLRSCQHDS